LNKTGQYEKSNRILQQAMHISCDPMLHNMAGLNHQARKRYREAEDCFTTAALLVPSRHYPHYLLMLLYAETAQREKAVEQAGILLTQPVKIPSEAIREMKQEAEKIIRNDH
jgi:tetratricopeptide (TPR) repeat protein